MASDNGVRLKIDRQRLDGAPGAEVEMNVDVYNSTDLIDGFDLAVVGLDQAESVQYEPRDLSLFPDASKQVGIKLTIPETYSSGCHDLAVRVTSKTNPEVYSYEKIPLHVEASASPAMTVDPEKITAGQKGRFAVTVRNSGGAVFNARLTADDPENELEFDFCEELIKVDSGAQVSSQMVAKGRRPLAGDPVTRLITVTATGEGTELEGTATLVQRPWIPRFVITIALVAALLGVWGVVVGAAIDKILDDTDTDLAGSITKGVDDVLDKLAPSAGGSAAGAATDIGGTGGPIPEGEGGVVRGRVAVYATDADEKIKPIAGAKVEAIALDSNDVINPNRDPVVAETNDAGSYKIADLGRGRYYLRVTAPGYVPIWVGKEEAGLVHASHPSVPLTATSFDGLDVLDIPWSGTRRNVTLVEAAGSVSGAVALGDDSGAGVTVELSLVDETGLATGATLTVETGESGTYRFPCPTDDTTLDAGATCSPQMPKPDADAPPEPQVLQPGTYLLKVSKDDFVTQVKTVEVTAGADIVGMDVALAPTPPPPLGSASFSAKGRITDGTDGIAGMVVEISGPASAKTVTDANGNYSFSVPLPGVYNLSFSKPGYVSAAAQVTIAADEPAPTIRTIAIAAEPVSMTGKVVDQDGNPIVGAKVFTSTDPGWCAAEDTSTAPTSQAGGVFVIPSVPIGRGTLCAEQPGYDPAWLDYHAEAGENVVDIEIVMNELVEMTGTVVAAGVPEAIEGRSGLDQFAVFVGGDAEACEFGQSSYQSVEFSGSWLVQVRLQLDLATGVDDPPESVLTTLRLWDPQSPGQPIAQSDVQVGWSADEPWTVHDLESIAVEPGRPYVLEWLADNTAIGWVRSTDAQDPYSPGGATACAPASSPATEQASSRDFAFQAVTALDGSVAGATITVGEVHPLETVSVAGGRFSAILPVGSHPVTVTHPDYQTMVGNMVLAPDPPMRLELDGKPGSIAGSLTCDDGCTQPTTLTLAVNGVAAPDVDVDPATGSFSVDGLATPSVVTLGTGEHQWTFTLTAGQSRELGDIGMLIL